MSNVVMLRSRAIFGLNAPSVIVEVHISAGLPSFSIVGLADVEVRESRDRVRSAISNTKFNFPARRITVNLAPADLPKESGRYDLAIALGILIANGNIKIATHIQLEQYEFIGELALNGDLREISGILAIAYNISLDKKTLFLPKDNAMEAGLIDSLSIVPLDSLQMAVDILSGQKPISQHSKHSQRDNHQLNINQTNVNQTILNQLDGAKPIIDQSDIHQTNTNKTSTTNIEKIQLVDSNVNQTWSDKSDKLLDFIDIKGQMLTKKALEIAASGMHSVLLVGNPGCGKSMLAACYNSILPELNTDKAIETASIYSVASCGFEIKNWKKPPFRSPHHSSSSVSIVGGGASPKPGEISLAHNGVLFLDELPHFDNKVLQLLREPLETKSIHIARASWKIKFLADFQLIGAMNPCPCGNFNHPIKMCNCSADAIQKYQAKLSGPLLDRIDISIDVPTLLPHELIELSRGESSAVIQQRVIATRALQFERQNKLNYLLNNHEIEKYCVDTMDNATRSFLQQITEKFALSARGYYRLLKIARTISDAYHACYEKDKYSNCTQAIRPIKTSDLSQAVQYKTKCLN